MSEESKEKALPGYKSLADSMKDLAEATKVNGEKNNEKLDKIIESKDRQYGTDIKQYENWRKEKIRGAWISRIQTIVILIALYLDIIGFNGDNPIVSGFGQMLARLTGGLL